jgi:hypothetical protein
MKPEEKNEEHLSRIKKWWDMNNQYGSKRFMWTVYHSNNKSSKGKKLMQNIDLTDPEQALDMLLEAIANFAPSSDKYITVVVYTHKTDPAPLQMDFINPYYESNMIQSAMPMVNGSGSVIQQGYSKQDLDKFVEERVSQIKETFKIELQATKKEMEYQRQLEDMQAQIEGISSSQQSMLDKAMGLLENPTIAGIVSGIIGKFVDPPKEIEKNAKTQVENQVVTASSDNVGNEEYSEEEIAEGHVIENSINALDDAFDGEGINVLAEIALLAKQQPLVLRQLRSQMQQMIKNEGS